MTARPTWIAGNWKMNLLRASGVELATALAQNVSSDDDREMTVFPPAPFLAHVADAVAGSAVSVGAQACHPAASGAHTGETSVAMIADAGGTVVLCGHSERRAAGLSDEAVGERARAALAGGLRALVCIGETLEDREAGRTAEVVTRQAAAALDGIDSVDEIDLAYEPVWAIGTGRTATPDMVAETHAVIRAWLRERFGAAGDDVRILYGGSVKPANAAELLAVENVGGVLVGGASLTSDAFLAIHRAR